jgi:hypothetical protein
MLASGAIFTTFHLLRSLRMGPIIQSVTPCQAFPAQCSVTLKLIETIRKLQRKLIVVNALPELVFAKLLADFFAIIIWVGAPYHKSGQGFYVSFCN